MKPIKLQRMKRTNCWQPARPVWFQKNDDSSSKDIDEMRDKAMKGTLTEEDKDIHQLKQIRRDVKKREGYYE